MTVYTPQPGDIGLVSIKGGEGVAIRIGQWLNGDGYANYEHAFTYVGAGSIVEAEPGGARRSALGEYGGRDVVWLRCPVGRGDAVARGAEGLIGTPYSWLDYAALAARRLHLPFPGARQIVRSSHSLICSQLCDLAAQRGGWHLFDDGRAPGYVTPGALYKLAAAQAADDMGVAA